MKAEKVSKGAIQNSSIKIPLVFDRAAIKCAELSTDDN